MSSKLIRIGKQINSYFFNAIKLKDIIIFKKNNKKIAVNSNEINYNSLDIRDIKINLIKFYFNNVYFKKSIRAHLFNYLYQVDYTFHKKSCLIKYLLDKNVNVDEIIAPFLSKKDISFFISYNLKKRKIKRLKIKFKPEFVLFSMLILLRWKKKKHEKLVNYFSQEKSRFNQKIKYTTMLRAKMKHFENIYLNKLNKSLNNTIIYIDPSLSSYTWRQEEYLEYLKRNKRNYFFYVPKINFYKILIKAVIIAFSMYPNELKNPLLEIFIQRIKIDDIVKKINRSFPDIREFYAGDKTYIGTTYLNEKLKKKGIKVIGYAHGVGVSCSLVNYDLFYVFTEMQKSFYFGSSKFKFYSFLPSFNNIEDHKENPLALFFIGSVFSNLKYYNSVYNDVINFVEGIARECEIPVYAKYHPLSTERDKIFSKNIMIVENVEDLPKKYTYLSITLNSTYVLELLNSMPFLIINPQNKINIKFKFSDNEFLVVKNYQQVKEKIEYFLKNPDYYYKYWQKLISFFVKVTRL